MLFCLQWPIGDTFLYPNRIYVNVSFQLLNLYHDKLALQVLIILTVFHYIALSQRVSFSQTLLLKIVWVRLLFYKGHPKLYGWKYQLLMRHVVAITKSFCKEIISKQWKSTDFLRRYSGGGGEKLSGPMSSLGNLKSSYRHHYKMATVEPFYL